MSKTSSSSWTRGQGVLESVFGDLRYGPGDYLVIPRGATYRLAPDGFQRYLIFTSPGEIEIPRSYRNEHGQLLEHAPYYHRDIRTPGELRTHDARSDHIVMVRVGDGIQTVVLDHHPCDVVGWDGFVYPWALNIKDFEPIAGRVHVPPPAHQTFEGRNFVICSFCPRLLDWDPNAVPVPYHHSNVDSEEFVYYVSGNFSSRRGVAAGSATLHPSGLAHGPQPGVAEASLGMTRTEELAVMCDTFAPLTLTELARDIEDPTYTYSWSTDAAGVAPVSQVGSREEVPNT